MKKIIFLILAIIVIGILMIKLSKVSNSISIAPTNSNITRNSEVAGIVKTNSKISVIAQTNNGALKTQVRTIDYPPEQFKFILDLSGNYATINSNRQVLTLMDKSNHVIISTNLVKAAEGIPMAGNSIDTMELGKGWLVIYVGREIFQINLQTWDVEDFGQN